MIGQKDNLKRLNPLPLLTILYGLPGSGRWTLLSTIAKEQGYTPIKTNGDIDTIRGLVAITNTDNKNLYVINNDDLGLPSANTLLKSTEEGIGNVRFAIKATTNNVLPTLKSRATMLKMEPYTDEEQEKIVKQFTSSQSDYDLLSSLFVTPGQILGLINQEGGIKYATGIVSLVANLANCDYGDIVSVFDTLDFKGTDIARLPVGLFLLTFARALWNKYTDLDNAKMYRVWGQLNTTWARYTARRVDMVRAITAMLLNISAILG